MISESPNFIAGGGILNLGPCKHPRCRNSRRRDGRDCHRCAKRAWRERRPYQAAFATLRDHARAREIEFTLTFAYFYRFAKRSHYVERKGSTRDCLTVDRIKNHLGYIPGNIQPLTRSENSVKRCKQDHHRMRCGLSWQRAA